MNKIEKKLNKFIKTLEQSGVLDWTEKLQKKFPQAEIYLVGGAVRDILLGIKEVSDLDFVVRKVSMSNLEKFLSTLGWVEELGKNFGVLKFKPKKNIKDKNFEALDIALPRKEFSTAQGGYKDFKVKFDKDLNLEQDLLRRDFTINAIAVKLTTPSRHVSGHPSLKSRGQIIDPFDGIKDIKNKLIKCVGKAEERLSEDYTRILRAVRFSCQLDFAIDKKTQSVIKKLAKNLNTKNKEGDFISPREIIAKDFLKSFNENYLKTIELYDKLDLFKILMPEVLTMKKCPQPKNYHTEGDVWQHTLLALKNFNSKKFVRFQKNLDKLLISKIKNQETGEQKQDLELKLALFFHDLGKPPTIQTPKKDQTDRIRFNNHDNVGADLAKKICERLKLSAPERISIDVENIAWLIRKHMILVQGHPSEFKPTTIEKYFFNSEVSGYPGKNLIKLAWLDISATITKNGPLKHDLIKALLKRIREMKKLVKNKKTKQGLPKPFLDGDEIMKILKIKPGKEVGRIKDKLREKQLSGEVKNKKQAEEIIKEYKV